MNKYRDMDIIHPRPWCVDVDRGGECQGIIDALGDPVIITDSGFYPPNKATAEFICKCVNERKD
jgi:hypothetical protein